MSNQWVFSTTLANHQVKGDHSHLMKETMWLIDSLTHCWLSLICFRWKKEKRLSIHFESGLESVIPVCEIHDILIFILHKVCVCEREGCGGDDLKHLIMQMHPKMSLPAASSCILDEPALCFAWYECLLASSSFQPVSPSLACNFKYRLFSFRELQKGKLHEFLFQVCSGEPSK